MSKRYLTREGFDRFQAELRELWNVERRKVVAEVQTAAAHGDRSENAEYIYGKKRLREIDRRVRYLTKMLDEATVVEPEVRDTDKVFFGAHVTVEDEDGEQTTWQLVGRDEVEPKLRRISLDSPMGRALFGKRLDDTLVVQRPRGEMELTIVGVSYVEPRKAGGG